MGPMSLLNIVNPFRFATPFPHAPLTFPYPESVGVMIASIAHVFARVGVIEIPGLPPVATADATVSIGVLWLTPQYDLVTAIACAYPVTVLIVPDSVAGPAGGLSQ
jgi:hypothetical protein